jgi:hypothetical protein
MLRDEEHGEELPLPQGSALQRQLAQLDRLEPPPELDHLVLARAREAIQAAPPTPFYRAPRWGLPFGLAATLAVACGLWLAMRGLHPGEARAPIAATPAEIAPAVAASAAVAVPPPAPAPALAAAQAPAPLAANAEVAEPRRSSEMPRARAAPRASQPEVSESSPLERSLRHIAELRSQGKTAEAEREWTALVERYPGLRQSAAATR